MTEHQEQKDVSFRVSRVAHWLLNDSGFTRAMAAKELAEIARTLSPHMASMALGDAAEDVDVLRAQLDAAQANAKRLDWLQTQIMDDSTQNFGAFDCADRLWHLRDGSTRDTLREAIDAAMESSAGVSPEATEGPT